MARFDEPNMNFLLHNLKPNGRDLHFKRSLVESRYGRRRAPEIVWDKLAFRLNNDLPYIMPPFEPKNSSSSKDENNWIF